ncbi:MAG: hypothetical protein ACI9TY_001607 [Alphaproteobacteria bacterium]|jgi:hypothetical protein
MKKLSITCAALLLASCSAFQPNMQKINIATNESDAKILVNGQTHMSPVQIEVPRNKSLSIQAVKSGYHSSMMTVDTKLSSTGAVDAAGGLFLIFLG